MKSNESAKMGQAPIHGDMDGALGGKFDGGNNGNIPIRRNVKMINLNQDKVAKQIMEVCGYVVVMFEYETETKQIWTGRKGGESFKVSVNKKVEESIIEGIWEKSFHAVSEWVGDVETHLCYVGIEYNEGMQPISYALSLDGLRLSALAKEKYGLTDFDLVTSIEDWHNDGHVIGNAEVTYGLLLTNEEMLENE